jgi:hypothetical protein
MLKVGFDSEKSVLPVVPGHNILIDGGHRLGTALALGIPVACEYINLQIANNSQYSAEFFKKVLSPGLAEEYLDAMALEYATLKGNTYIVSLFPIGNAKYADVKKILSDFGAIIYEKELYLNKYGPRNYTFISYEEEGGGRQENDYSRPNSQADGWFPKGEGKVKIILYECESLSKVVKAKSLIRELNGTRYSIHINDRHDETVKVAQTVFLKNSIHWLNNAKILFFKNFDKYIKQYKQWIADANLNPELLCIDSSAILSAYGLRDCNDLDFLSLHDVSSNNPYIADHREELKFHAFSKEDIIFNPNNHFYYRGIKFAALHVVRAMKLKRNEEKDRRDLKLIDSVGL